MSEQENNVPSGKRVIAPALTRDSSMDDKDQVAIALFEALHGRQASTSELLELRDHAAELERKNQSRQDH